MNTIYNGIGFDLSEAFCWFFVSFVSFCRIPFNHEISYRSKRRKRRGKAESGRREAQDAMRLPLCA